MHRTDSYAMGRRKSNHLGVVVKNLKLNFIWLMTVQRVGY